MKANTKQLIDLYVYRKVDKSLSILLFKRSKNKIYSGQWRMIGGKTKPGEARWQAALRELKEETGLLPNLFWSVPTLNHFYEPGTDQIHLIPAFAAEIADESTIELDDEHSEYRWVPAPEVSRYIHWPEQNRIITCINSIVMNDQILQDWIIRY